MSHQHSNPGPKDQPVHRITEAHESHSSERDLRVRKYTISMTVRMVCFILAFFFEGWIRWVMLAGAIVLPYIAVVIANGGADLTKREPPAEFYTGTEPEQLENKVQATGTEEPEVVTIDGTLVEPAPPTETPKEQ